jgi:SAM-dependent methyltransferase
MEAAKGREGFPDYFSARSSSYARHRPDYPPALFEWIASQAPGRERAWDCATGNGQAAVALAERFEEVIATDASAQQLEHAFDHPRVRYRLARAEASGVETSSIAAITVAQALHWFDQPAFYEEARRVLVPGGVLVVWCYGLFRATASIDRVLDRFYSDVVGPYWPPDRAAIEARYRDVVLPFEPLAVPELAMEKDWTAADALGYVRTWSATTGFARERGFDPVDDFAPELEREWGGGTRRVRWPLTVLASRAR